MKISCHKNEMLFIGLVIIILIFTDVSRCRAEENGEIKFAIHSFYIEGNSVLAKEILTEAVGQFTGENKTADDVESARDALEKVYHQSGYPTVLVNIPEQTVDTGVVKLEVIESRIKRVRVVGNKYFTMENIKDQLPGITPGKILFLPQIREELSMINRNPDLKVAPVLIPGRELGTIDVELKVEDKLPLHGSIELNNRSTHTTTETRLNGMIRYDNLWQKGHSINAQFQSSPQDFDEVKVFSTSYTMPAPWKKDHLLIGYLIFSDSETASGEGFNVIGEGTILGFRYLMPLPSLTGYDHNVTMGFDWKDFKEDTQGDVVPIEYIPISFGYMATLTNKKSQTQFNFDVNFLLRDFLVNDMDEFQAKRFGSTGNYVYFTAGIERRQKLTDKLSLFVKLDGQIADQPLVNNEQYAAGGVGSVRGYKESEVLGDNAFHGTIELLSPGLVTKIPLVPYLFYDCAWIGRREALAGEKSREFLQSLGIGATGSFKDSFDFKIDWGIALEDTDDSEAGDHEVHFRFAYRF